MVALLRSTQTCQDKAEAHAEWRAPQLFWAVGWHHALGHDHNRYGKPLCRRALWS